MSNEEREALATVLSRTIRLSVAISVALAMLIVLVTNYLQNQAINRRIDEIEQMMKQRPQNNTNSVIIGQDKAALIEELARERLNAGLQ
jgi:low affinity Fe/Cu permease